MRLLLAILVSYVSCTNVVMHSEDHPDAVPYPWTANWGLTSSQFQAYLSQYSSTGYMPVHIDGYVIGGVIYFSIIAEQKPGQWSVQYNLTAVNFNSTNQFYSNIGYHLQRISVYDNTFGSPFYAGVWVNVAGFKKAWQFNTGLSMTDLNNLVNKMSSYGYWPIQVEMYALLNSQVQFAVIFQTHAVSDPAWFAIFMLTSAQYQNQISVMSNQGYRLTQISAVTWQGQQYYGGIWQQTSSTWQTSWGMSTQSLQTIGSGWVNQGYQFTDIQGYVSNSASVLYSALWDQTGLNQQDDKL